jgi:PE family/PPE-SVP subfamily C-terminal region
MSFVTTAPAAIAAAATSLEGVGTSFATESSAAAGSTTAISPAAADEVSVLQSGVFSSYGQLYQTVSAQAQAIHQQFVNALQQSSGSYQDTESANQAATAAQAASSGTSAAAKPAAVGPITSFISSITGFLTTGPLSSVVNNNAFSVGFDEVGNFTSGYSDLIGMGGGGLLTALAGPSTASADLGGLGSSLVGDVGPAAAVGGVGGVGGASAMGAAPVLASAGAGSSIGPMSVPPSWAGGAGAGLPATSAPVTLASQSWTTPAPTTGGMGPGIAGMPAVANGGRGGSSFGAPRYGVKPKVMPPIPKPTIT